MPTTSTPNLLDQRLDALDRILLGLLPRTERIAFVAQVEVRISELADAIPALESSAAGESSTLPDLAALSASPRAAKRRSRLALSSGILGIVALVMLFAMPITYVIVSIIGESMGELVAYSLLIIHVLTVAVGGLVAIVMGITGLVRLARRKGRMVGHGWAITALCTAPLPTLVGGLLAVTFLGVSFGGGGTDYPSPPNVASAPYALSPITSGELKPVPVSPADHQYAPSNGNSYAPCDDVACRAKPHPLPPATTHWEAEPASPITPVAVPIGPQSAPEATLQSVPTQRDD